MYSSYYRIIKCVDFEPIHYVINLNVVSYSKVLANLIVFSIECIISLNQ